MHLAEEHDGPRLVAVNGTARGSRQRDLVDHAEPVEGARVADEGQQLGDDIDQARAIVADVEVRRHVPLHLRLAAAERDQHREREEFAGTEVMPVRVKWSPKQFPDR